jgi:hypothetical protein
LEAFTTAINSLGLGVFTVLSVGETQQFTLLDVLVQDVKTMAVMYFKRVDFILESMNPFIVHKIIISPDERFFLSHVTPTDTLSPSLFRLQNPLHLFYPYRTSENEMLVEGGLAPL